VSSEEKCFGECVTIHMMKSVLIVKNTKNSLKKVKERLESPNLIS